MVLRVPAGWEETLQWQLANAGWGDGVFEQAFPAGHLDDEPLGRPDQGTLSFVFDEARRGDFLADLERLAEKLGWEEGAWSIRSEAVLREDWETAWREKWRPFRCAGFVVHAPFHGEAATPRKPGDRPLLIPTGSAFGTGGHPSTRIALRCLRRWAGERTPAKVLDVGMGTGVLGVASAMLGAHLVVGMDPDPPAAAQARLMAEQNGVGAACRFYRGVAESVTGRWDWVLANLQSGLLQRYATDLAARLAPEGRLFTGGFMDRNAPATLAAFEGAGLRLERLHEHGRWRAAELGLKR